MTAIQFTDPRDSELLDGYLGRLLHFDKTAAVRLVGIGPAVGVYGGPPLHGTVSRDNVVLTVRTVALRPETEPFDRTVSAGQLVNALTPDRVELPAPLVGGPAWAGLLPPRTGWRPLGEIPVARLAQEAATGTADFRFNALGRDRAGLDALAEQIWSRQLAHGLRLRSAHTAAVMGFLGPENAEPTVAAVAGHHRWIRLNAPFGTVVERA
jgi:hypothetical protein